MSQLADIQDIVAAQPMEQLARAQLFFDLVQALGWEVDGVYSPADAEIYLFQMRTP
jgi:hypothetical protein